MYLRREHHTQSLICCQEPRKEKIVSRGRAWVPHFLKELSPLKFEAICDRSKVFGQGPSTDMQYLVPCDFTTKSRERGPGLQAMKDVTRSCQLQGPFFLSFCCVIVSISFFLKMNRSNGPNPPAPMEPGQIRAHASLTHLAVEKNPLPCIDVKAGLLLSLMRPLQVLLHHSSSVAAVASCLDSRLSTGTRKKSASPEALSVSFLAVLYHGARVYCTENCTAQRRH